VRRGPLPSSWSSPAREKRSGSTAAPTTARAPSPADHDRAGGQQSSSSRSAEASAPSSAGPPSHSTRVRPRPASWPSRPARSAPPVGEPDEQDGVRAGRRDGAPVRPVVAPGEGDQGGPRLLEHAPPVRHGARTGDLDDHRSLSPALLAPGTGEGGVGPRRPVPLGAGRPGADEDDVGEPPAGRGTPACRGAADGGRPAVRAGHRPVQAGHHVRAHPGPPGVDGGRVA
jgi:hypothetical protein